MLGQVLPWVALLAVGASTAYLLLGRIAAGHRGTTRDPTEVANRALAEANAFRGAHDRADPPWDGVNRLAPPTNEW